MKGGELHVVSSSWSWSEAWSCSSFSYRNGSSVACGREDVICKKPFRKGVGEFGCGQCLPCRINSRREWVGRMMLELLSARVGLFVTLTYGPECLPPGGNLQKRDLQLFMKRLRYFLRKEKVRFFACGEYGEKTWRPHYHLILFGVSFAERELVLRSWTKGLVHVGIAEADSMQYVAGYVTKKMTSVKDKRLKGRAPEFALMSRSPGIGFPAVEEFAKSIEKERGAVASLKSGWIPTVFQVGSKKWPMGRYVATKLHARLNITKEARKAKNFELQEKMYVIKMSMSTDEYEASRKARVEQSMGRYNIERRKPL